MNIQHELMKAKEAAEQLANLRALERQAARLPELERQVEQEQNRQTAAVGMKQAVQEASVTLTAARSTVSELKPRYRDLKVNLMAIMAEMAEIQSEINKAEQHVKAAAVRVARAAHDNGGGVWGPVPMTEAAVTRAFHSAWTNAGGFDSLLAEIFDGKPDKLDLALLRTTGVHMRLGR